MSKKELFEKLGSRKFFALVAAFVTSVMIFSGADPESIERVGAMIGAFSSIAVYIFAQAQVDIKKEELKLEEVKKEPIE